MKKILLTMIVLSAAAFNSFAQSSSKSDASGKFSIGVDAGIPVGNASNYTNFVIGGDLKYSMPVASGFDVSLSAGYTEFMGKTFSETFDGQTISVKENVKAIPVKVAGRYNFNGSTGFFAEVGLGAAFIQDGGGTAFVYAPGVGYALDGGLELGVRYEGWSKTGTISQVALRVAYSF